MPKKPPITREEALEPNPKCGSIKKDGKTCNARAGWKTDHPGVGRCKFHGGNTSYPAFVDRMRIAVADRAAHQELVRLNIHAPEVDNPRAVLLEELQRSVGIVRWLERRIWVDTIPDRERTNPDDPDEVPIPWTHDEISERLLNHEPELLQVVTNEMGGESLAEHPLWPMFNRERSYMVSVSMSCHKAGIETAMIDAYLDSGRLLVAAITMLFARLGLDMYTDENVVIVREVLANQPALGVTP